MKVVDRTGVTLLVAFAALVAAMPLLPSWVPFLVTVALAKGLVVLGLLLLMRTGLVSFGQGLYYAIGGYAAGLASQKLGIRDAIPLLALAALAGAAAAAVLGVLLARYRSIFFAMLTLAFSMILYGLLVKTPALGSTDGFNVEVQSIAGISSGRFAGFVLTALCALVAGLALHGYLRSHIGRLAPAVRDNELRVEYMGASVHSVVYLNLVITAALASAGGALTAFAVGHIDPEMAYWTTSGEFVFVAILGGTASVAAPFLGALVLELLRSFAYEHAPNAWQMVVGGAMLLVILFFPAGLFALFAARRKAA